MPIDDRTENSIGIEDMIQMFPEMEARKIEIPINGNKYLCVCVCVCGTAVTLLVCYDMSMFTMTCDAHSLHYFASGCWMILFHHCILPLQTFISDSSPSLSKSKVLSSEGSTSGVPSPVTQVKGKEHSEED
jgi:hypothetical protein